MTTYFEGRMADVSLLEAVLIERTSGMVFSCLKEAKNFIDEMVCDLVERPAYNESDLDFWRDGGDIPDLFENAADLQEMKKGIVARIAAEQDLV